MKIRVYADLHLYYRLDEMNRYDINELLDLQNELILHPVDMLIFAGDLTHKVYSTDDLRFVNCMRFVARVREICQQTNTQFRIIKGTSTHEGKVIDVLKKIYEDDPYLKCYTNVGYEEFKGVTFRYLPEPYFDTYNSFYEYAFREPADVTIFHGTIDGVIPFLKQTDNPTNLAKSVLMKANDLRNNTRLFSVGGHIHRHINIDNDIFYVNSLTTHNFSDVDDIKGYMEFIIDDNLKWSYKFIPNTKAPKYKKFVIDKIHNLTKDEIRSIIGNVLIASKKEDHISFLVVGKKDIKAMSNLGFIKSLMKNYNVRIEQRLDDIIEDDTLSEKADFYADDTIPIEEKIRTLVEEDYGMRLSLDEIKKYIS